MKKNKNKLFMGLSVLIIGFLISTSSLNIVSTKALLEGENNQYITESFDRFDWKWTFTEIVSTESTWLSYFPSIAVDTEGNVHVAWFEDTDYGGSGNDYDILYKRKEASTSTWTMTEVVSTESTSDSERPSIATDVEGNVHIVWHEDTNYGGSGDDLDIFYKRWNTSTSTWSMTEVISTESSTVSWRSSVTADAKGNVHIAWEDLTDYAGAGATDMDIFYKRWEASSSTWTMTEVVSTESIWFSDDVSIVTDAEGNVHITWRDETGSVGDRDILYKRWEVSTSSWTMTEIVSIESTSDTGSPSIAADVEGNVHITWQDNTDYAGCGDDYDILYKRWEASISTWIMTEVVTTESISDSEYPSIATDVEGNGHIVWDEETNYAGSGDDYDILYKRWEAYTSTWTITEVVSTESIRTSRRPSFTIDIEGNGHIVWEDNSDIADTDALTDVYYKQLVGSTVAPELAFIVPNPTDLSSIYLDWNNICRATSYYVYRSTSYIWSVEDLIPIAAITSSEFFDTLPLEGFYYYVIVAGNYAGNSTHSNCQYVEYKLPHVREFTIISSLVLGAFVVSLVVLKTRKNKLK
ncbi:MAG: hypothetical protein ACTSSN_09975 [Candidatus Heimdallarchaeaceae archaeon]